MSTFRVYRATARAARRTRDPDRLPGRTPGSPKAVLHGISGPAAVHEQNEAYRVYDSMYTRDVHSEGYATRVCWKDIFAAVEQDEGVGVGVRDAAYLMLSSRLSIDLVASLEDT